MVLLETRQAVSESRFDLFLAKRSVPWRVRVKGLRQTLKILCAFCAVSNIRFLSASEVETANAESVRSFVEIHRDHVIKN